MLLQQETVTLHPTNHYLDIISKITAQGGNIFDLKINNECQQVSFKHRFPHSDVIFEENILYDNDNTISEWTTGSLNKTYVIYKKSKS